MSEYLLRRDVPLPRGTRLEVRITSTYTILVGDLVVDQDETEITFHELQKRLGKYESIRISEIERHYACDLAESDWFLPAQSQHYTDYRFLRDGEASYVEGSRIVNLPDLLGKVEA